MYFYFERLHASNLTTEIVKSTRKCPVYYKKRRLLFTFCCALNHQKIGAQQPLPRVNYLSGKKVDKFDSKSDFFLFEIREHSLCWYSKPTQLFVISSTVCILIYLCMDSRFNLIIQINFSMTQMYSYSL